MALTFAVRVAIAAHTPFDTVSRWPWHKAVGVWAEARDAQDEAHSSTWRPLLKVWYKDE